MGAGEHARVLLVSHRSDDHAALQKIFRNSSWEVNGAFTARAGVDFLRQHYLVPVIINDCNLPDADWRWVLKELRRERIRSSFILSARLADERLWAEALNLGAFDLLLAAPFDPEEVIRVTESAWLDWNRDRGLRALSRIGPGLAWKREDVTAGVRAAGDPT